MPVKWYSVSLLLLTYLFTCTSTGCGNKVSPWDFFCSFLRNRLEFQSEILTTYLVIHFVTPNSPRLAVGPPSQCTKRRNQRERAQGCTGFSNGGYNDITYWQRTLMMKNSEHWDLVRDNPFADQSTIEASGNIRPRRHHNFSTVWYSSLYLISDALVLTNNTIK